MIDDRRPPTRRLTRVAVIVVLAIAALIALIFLGENAAQMKDMARERAVPAPQGGVHRVTPPPGRD